MSNDQRSSNAPNEFEMRHPRCTLHWVFGDARHVYKHAPDCEHPDEHANPEHRSSEPWNACPHFPNDEMMRRRCACWDWPDRTPRTNETTHAIGEPRCTLCGSARLVRNSQPLACSFTQCRDPLHDFCVENGVRCGAIDPPWPDTLPCTREKGHRGSHRSDRLPPENGWVSWPNDEPGAYDEQRPQEATTKENGMRCSHCGNDICDPCWKARVDRRIGSDLSEDALGRIEGMIRGAKSVEEIWTTPADAMSLIREVRRRRAEVGDEYTRANAVRDKVQVDPRVAEVVSAATALCEDEDARAWSRLRFALDALPLVVAEQRLDYPQIQPGARVRSASLPHHEGTVRVVERKVIVAVQWDRGALKEHPPTSLVVLNEQRSDSVTTHHETNKGDAE